MKSSSIATACLILLGIFNLSNSLSNSTLAAPGAKEASAVAGNQQPVSAPRTAGAPIEKVKRYDKNALHRLDFRIKGKSCPVCLLGIQRRIKALDGTVQAAVMLKSPYGASVIYDSKQISEQTLLDTAKANEPLIKLLDINDQSIAKVPAILIPPHTAVPELNSSANAVLSPSH